MTIKKKLSRKQGRLIALLVIGSGLLLAALLTLKAFSGNMMYFKTPSDIAAMSQVERAKNQKLRLGGLVKESSIRNDEKDTTALSFVITDLTHETPVIYRGIVPDLFREKQGVVAEGRLNEDGTLVADTLLARHDENYMPPEVANALEKQGAMPSALPQADWKK